jgi:molybdopterin-containing oxidoreductase family membrane subunit
MYSATIYDWLVFCGSWGLFLFCFLLFLRYVPMITMFEMRQTAHKAASTGGYA